MEYRTLDLTIVSAEDLKKVSHFSKMHPIAVAWVDPYNRQSTRADKNGGVNPTWNQRLSLPIAEQFFQQPSSRLHIEVHNKGLMSNTFVGAAVIPLSDLLQQANGKELMTYQLRRRSGRMKGAVRISAQIGEKVAATGPTGYGGATSVPVMAYPSGQNPQQGYYPQGGYQQQGYYPPQYPPQGYPQQAYYPQQPAGRYGRPGRMGGGLGGMGGMGTGLLAGGLGGLLIGDMIGNSHDYNGYGGGYDGGGYDGGGYDGGYDGGGGFDGGGFDGGGFDGGF